MADEQYQALARLIRRPMRRWWLRVGSWWLASIFALITGQALLMGYESINPISPVYGGVLTAPWWYDPLNALLEAVIPLSILLALLCSTFLVRFVDSAVNNSTAFTDRDLNVIKLKLAAMYSWPSILGIYVSCLIFNFQLYSRIELTSPVWSYLVTAFERSISPALMIVWLIVLVIVTKEVGWPIWLVFLSCIMVTSLMIQHLINLTGVSNLWQWNYQLIALPELQTTLLYIVGLFLVLFIPFLYLKQHRQLANILLILFVMMVILSELPFAFGDYSLDYIANLGRYLHRGFQPVEIGHSFYKGISLNCWFAGYFLTWKVTPIYAILPVLWGIVWTTVLYYSFILLFRNTKPKRGTPA